MLKSEPVMMFTTMYASPTLISMLSLSSCMQIILACTYNGLLLADKDAVANTEVLDEVVIRVQVKLYLEVATAVLLGGLGVLVWDHEVVHDTLLIRIVKMKVDLRSSSALSPDWFDSA